MKRFSLTASLIALVSTLSFGQKFKTESSSIVFFSKAAIEDIKAENTKAASIFDARSNEIVFSIPINDFEFDKSLMKEHFNEKYMDTEKYPKSLFKGKVDNFDLSREGIQNVTASGDLTIHGVTNKVAIPGTIQKDGTKLIVKAKFIVKLVDYKIRIPQLFWKNIAEQVEVTTEFIYAPQQ